MGPPVVVVTELDSGDDDDSDAAVVPAPRLLALAPPPTVVAAALVDGVTLLPALTEGDTNGLMPADPPLAAAMSLALSADFPRLSRSRSRLTCDCLRSNRLLGRRSNWTVRRARELRPARVFWNSVRPLKRRGIYFFALTVNKRIS